MGTPPGMDYINILLKYKSLSRGFNGYFQYFYVVAFFSFFLYYIFYKQKF